MCVVICIHLVKHLLIIYSAVETKTLPRNSKLITSQDPSVYLKSEQEALSEAVGVGLLYSYVRTFDHLRRASLLCASGSYLEKLPVLVELNFL